MQKYGENFATSAGRPVAGATVTVTNFPAGTLATIYSDNGSNAIGNPLITDALGYFEFYAANGDYSLTFTSSQTEPLTRSQVQLYDPDDGASSGVLAALGADDGAGYIGGTWLGGAKAKLTAMATAIGASLIGFVQSGIGAIVRAIQDELRETVKASQYGVKADGVTDNTDAIDAVIAAHPGKRIRFLPGITLTRGGHLVTTGTAIAGEGWNTTIKAIAGSNPAAMFMSGSESNYTTVEMYDIVIDGNKTQNPTGGHGIHLTRPINCHMTNVHVKNCHGDAFRYEANGSGFGSILRHCWAYGSDGVGIRMTGAGITDVHIIGGDIGYNATAGVVLATSCSISDAVVWGEQLPNATGIITAGSSWQINNCKVEGHGKHGIYVPAGNHFGFINGNKIYANSYNAATNGGYDGIYIEAGANYGTITNNKMYSSLSGVTTYLMRYAINFAGAHEPWTITGNDMTGLAAQGVPTTSKVVNGILETDKFDGNWMRTNVKARLFANIAAGAANAWTAFPYNLEDSDPLGEFSNGTFTPRNTGRYRIEAAFACTPAAAGENLGLALYTNAGVGVRRMAFFRSEGVNSEMVSGAIDEFLTAGTAYDLRYLVGSTSTTFLAGGDFTYVRIRAVPN